MRRIHIISLFVLLAIIAGVWLLTSRRWINERAGVSGLVRDGSGPVAGALVRCQGTNTHVMTDHSGRFRLPKQSDDAVRITAAKDGYVIAGAPVDAQRVHLELRRLPTADCEDYSWVNPGPDSVRKQNCGNCHREIYEEWSASSHARSMQNRRFLNVYDGSDWQGRSNRGWSLLAEHPDGAGVCNACHAPTAGFETDLRHTTGVTSHGIHCDFCHKVADAPTDKLGITHGRFGLKLLRPEKGQLFFGPLDDVDRNEDSYAAVYKESRYCASCHEGTVFGVHVYSTYSEWLDSPARRQGNQCQTCHMRPTGTFTNVAPGKGGIERDPQTLASHQFPGGQEEMLRRALAVETNLVREPANVRAHVRIRATSVGHRVPTGFVDRNLVLVVDAFDAAGRDVLSERGPVLPTLAGDCAGLTGRLYAKQLHDFDGKNPAPFWRANPEFVDSRLFPERPDESEFVFPPETERVRVRLLYRRFWPEVARIKGWPKDEITVVDRLVTPPQTSAGAR
jgi:hypothetical protein